MFMDASRKGGKSVEVLESEILRLREAVEQLTALNELSRLIGTAEDLDALNHRLVRQSLIMVGAEQGVVTLIHHDHQSSMATLLRTRVTGGKTQDFRPNTIVIGWVGANKKPLRIDDVKHAIEFDAGDWHPDVRSVLCVPLLIKERLIGVLTVFNKRDGKEFGEDAERMLSIIAMQSAQVIEKQRLSQMRNQELETQVAEKTAVLRQKNIELENTLSEVRRMQQQLIQKEKLASLGALTAGIAHELKNPLNFVNNFAELNEELAREARDAVANGETVDRALLDTLLENASKIKHHGVRADGIIRAMLDHARTQPGSRTSVDLNGLLDEYVNLAYHGMRARVPEFNAAIERNYDDRVGRVEMVPQEIGRVFLNLLDNAFYAVNERHASAGDGYAPTVWVETKRVEDQVEVRIKDNGPGIPRDVRDRVFEPFFTTKPAGSGTGLGLSLSYDIVVKGHGGELKVESEEGKSTVFIMALH